MKTLKALKKKAAESRICKSLVGFVKWLLVLLSLYGVAGSIMYPDWWRFFFWQEGMFDSAHLKLGIAVVKEEFGQFWPVGGILVLITCAVIVRLVFLYGKHGREFVNYAGFLRGPNWRSVFGFILLFAICGIGLVFRHPTTEAGFWDARNLEKWQADMANRLKALAKGFPKDQFAPPDDGVFLYLNDEAVTRQYQALSPALVIQSAKDKFVSNKEVSIDTDKLPFVKVGGKIGNEREKEVVSERVALSPPFAAQELLNQLIKSTNTIRLNSYGFWDQREYLESELKKYNVTLTDDQKEKLQEGERRHFEQEVLKTEHEKAFLYEGPIKITRNEKDSEITFDIRGLVVFHCRGILDAQFLHGHLALALAYAKPTTDITTIRLYGIIETRKKTDNQTTDIEFTPYTIW